MAQSINCLPLAQVMVPGSPALGSLLDGEPASPFPSAAPPACVISLSLSYSLCQIKSFKKRKLKIEAEYICADLISDFLQDYSIFFLCLALVGPNFYKISG